MSGVPAPRRVLLVLASTYPRWQGDPEPGFVHELSKRLANRFRVIVLGPHAPGAKAREVLDGVEVVRYRYAPERWETLVNDGGIVTNLKLHRWKLLLVPGFVLMQAWVAWRLCSSEGVDAIHAHWLIPQGLIAAVLGRPFLVTSHGADLYALRSGPLQALKRFVLRRAQVATVVSRAMLSEVARIGADAQKVAVLPMGVDMSTRFAPGDPQARNTDELLFVGRLVEKKGLRYLLDALPQVLRQRPGVTLTIAGFGPEEQALRAQVARLALDDAICFLGAVQQTELPALYRRAALCVAPFVQAGSGDQEGLGLVLVEASACGCPVLAGDVPAVRDVVEASEWRVDARDTDLLAQRIVDVLAMPLPRLQAHVNATRELLLARFDWDVVARLYADLLSGAGVTQTPMRDEP